MRTLAHPPTFAAREPVVSFAADRSVLAPLGEPSFVEEDTSRTFGGVESFWSFEASSGLRFQVALHESVSKAFVIADPPDGERVVAALKSLGVIASFAVHPPHPDDIPVRAVARRSVWVFVGDGSDLPTAVFSRKLAADEWISRARVSGRLLAYPLDSSRYEVARDLGAADALALPIDGIQTFVGNMGERYRYRDGVLIQEGT